MYIKHVKGLNQLESLHLAHTKVTDAGLENLKGPNQLQCLDLEKTEARTLA